MSLRYHLRALLVLLVTASPGMADFSGRVVRVLDGDTIEVMEGPRAVRVRLEGIDALELDQPCGREVTRSVERQAGGRIVTIREKVQDS